MTIRHRWGEPIAILENTPSGCQETERTCVQCGYVRITTHYPDGAFPGRAWRTRDGMRAEIEHTPPCRPVGNVEGLAA